MIKNLQLLCVALLGLSATAFSQGNYWTWMKGDSTYSNIGVYGTKGVASPSNNPGARYDAHTWADNSGNLYLFGGNAYTYASWYDAGADLWKYNINSNQWTWIAGNPDAFYTDYGNRGVAAATNAPGKRNAGCTWTDASGNFWLFGGWGGAATTQGTLSDLWKFDPVTNLWTWVSGDSVSNSKGRYGTKGVTSALNIPAGRDQAVCWRDNTGNLWLYGGYGYPVSGGRGMLNDLWKYNIATNQWTWMTGDSIMNQQAVYGTMGVTAPTNKPAASANAVSWNDKNGNLWMYGGSMSNTPLMYNAVWKYTPSTNLWTWMSGNVDNCLGHYNVKGVSTSTSRPGSRRSAVSFSDTSGNLWLFGGTGCAENGSGEVNDMWVYNVTSNKWIWMHGSARVLAGGRYGVKGLSSAGNVPESRQGHMSWVDASGNFWMFGGVTIHGTSGGLNDRFNDLWKFTPSLNYNVLTGSVFFDRNSNNAKEAAEPYFRGAKAVVTKGIDSFTVIAERGQFSVLVDTGTYTTKVSSILPYYNVSPLSFTTSRNAYFNKDSFSFAMKPLAGKRDVAISLFPLTPARPGFKSKFRIVYVNKGTDTLTAGTIKLVKASKLGYTDATRVPLSVVADTIIWSFTNLKPLDSLSIYVNFTVPVIPNVSIGEQLCLISYIDPVTGDLVPTDNKSSVCATVTASYDPNDKSESHGGSITSTQVANGEYLQYLIRFQNTGTDTAFTVSITDTLSDKLDWNSFEMVASSHNYQLRIKDRNKLQWTFDNIMLVDSNRNEPSSHGYIVLRIKPKADVQQGEVIYNKGHIYFDYNPAVITNTTSTAIVVETLPVSLLSFKAAKDGDANLLRWSATQEVNVRHFEIERSANGREFYIIGKLNAGAGNYEFRDNTFPRAVNFYRLRLVDNDGSYEYSPVRMVDNSSGFIVNAYPNPAKEIINVQVSSEKQGNVQVQVVAQDGRIVLSKQWTVNEGSTTQQLELNGIASGIYILRVVKENGTQQVVRFEKR